MPASIKTKKFCASNGNERVFFLKFLATFSSLINIEVSKMPVFDCQASVPFVYQEIHNTDVMFIARPMISMERMNVGSAWDPPRESQEILLEWLCQQSIRSASSQTKLAKLSSVFGILIPAPHLCTMHWTILLVFSHGNSLFEISSRRLPQFPFGVI